MARPIKDGLDYFPHDTNASSDIKLEPLIMLYKSAGYAFYFLHLEYIYRAKDFMLNISDAETTQILCQKLGINSAEYKQILTTALNRGCFDKAIYEQTGCLTSDGIKKRARTVMEKRARTRSIYDLQVPAAETTQESGSNAAETRQSKVKESKVNEIKEKTIKRFVVPTLEEVTSYCKERKNNIDPSQFIDFYTSKGWQIGKNPMRDWKACVRTWEKERKPKVVIYKQDVPQKHNFAQRR